MATATPPEALLTAEAFAAREGDGSISELIQGEVVRMTPPGARHGQICAEAVWILRGFTREHDLEHVLSNDSGVITTRNPDSVCGADVAFYSYARLPKGALTSGYPAVGPDLVVEVLSPNDRWPAVLAKVTEYLAADVAVVVVLDDSTTTAHVYHRDAAPQSFPADAGLSLPQTLPGFSIPVRRFFE